MNIKIEEMWDIGAIERGILVNAIKKDIEEWERLKSLRVLVDNLSQIVDAEYIDKSEAAGVVGNAYINEAAVYLSKELERQAERFSPHKNLIKSLGDPPIPF